MKCPETSTILTGTFYFQVDSFPIDQESIEIPESYSDSTINEEEEDDNDVSINYEDDEEEDSADSEVPLRKKRSSKN